MIFGSPGLVHSFLELDAIDEFWIFQNPILLGAGLPYFQGAVKTKLKLASHKPFENGVIRLHYVKAHRPHGTNRLMDRLEKQMEDGPMELTELAKRLLPRL